MKKQREFGIYWCDGWVEHDFDGEIVNEPVGVGNLLFRSDSLALAEEMARLECSVSHHVYGEGVVVVLDEDGQLVGPVRGTFPVHVCPRLENSM